MFLYFAKHLFCVFTKCNCLCHILVVCFKPMTISYGDCNDSFCLSYLVCFGDCCWHLLIIVDCCLLLIVVCNCLTQPIQPTKPNQCNVAIAIAIVVAVAVAVANHIAATLLPKLEIKVKAKPKSSGIWLALQNSLVLTFLMVLTC